MLDQMVVSNQHLICVLSVVVLATMMLTVLYALVASILLSKGVIGMYLDVTHIKETNITVKIARSENGDHFVIIRSTSNTDVIPVGNDYTKAMIAYKEKIEYHSCNKFIL